MKLNKVVNFLKSKSFVDFVYLVMMILIVTMIKDMIVSMYKKRKDKQWLNQAFGKTKGGKNVEGFTGTPWTTSNCGSAIGDTASVCDRLKFLLCDDNFNKLTRLLNGITLSSNGFNINTNGGDIDLRDNENAGGNIWTIRMYANDAKFFNGIIIPKIHNDVYALKFYPEEVADRDYRKSSLDMLFLPTQDKESRKFQIRSTIKYARQEWSDLYKIYQNNNGNRNYGIADNGKDYNDNPDDVYTYFKHHSEGLNMNDEN